MSTRTSAALGAALACLAALTLGACGSGGGDDERQVTLVSHASFAVSPDVLAAFEKKSGYHVRVLKDGDAGTAVNKAMLTKEHPQGDVFFGVDNTLLSRALDGGLFAPYRSPEAKQLDPAADLDPKHRVTPVDSGDLCVNYDRAYFTKHHLAPPESLEDLASPRYRDLLVTENAGTSSPGLGFLLGTAAHFGDEGWQGYWKKLKANGVKVVDGWEQAYNQEFSGSAAGRKAKGDRPLVVSYASSPPAEVIYAKPRPSEAPTAVATGTCFRQVEFAGVLHGAKNPEGAKALVDFLVSKRFQEDMPLNMFVDPVRKDAEAPADYRRFAAKVEKPNVMEPRRIAEHRDAWVRTWNALVLK